MTSRSVAGMFRDRALIVTTRQKGNTANNLKKRVSLSTKATDNRPGIIAFFEILIGKQAGYKVKLNTYEISIV